MVQANEIDDRNTFIRRVTDSLRKSMNQQCFLYIALNQASKVVQITEEMRNVDKLVEFVGNELQHGIGGRDLLGQLTPTEWGLLVDASPKEAYKQAEYLVELVAESVFSSRQEYYPKINIGIYVIEATDQVGKIFFAAEHAQELACKKGDSTVIMLNSRDKNLRVFMDFATQLRMIRRAIKKNDLVLFQQPIKMIGEEEDGEHYEILVRLKQSTRMLQAGQFLPAAEHHQAMPEIDRYMIKGFCQAYQKLYVLEKRNLNLATINLSAASVRDRDMPEFITELIAENEIPPYKICFEISERVANRDIDAATHLMHELKDAGHKLSLDRVGVGSSNLGNLHKFPIDYMKIDGEFIRDLPSSRSSRDITKFLNFVAHNHFQQKVQTIAEHVENQQSYDVLKKFGIDYAQGNFLGSAKLLYSPTRK